MTLPGWQTWVDDDVPTAAEVAGLADQMVHVWDDDTARTSGWSNPELGAVSWLVNPGRVDYFDGTHWRPIWTQPERERTGATFGPIPPRIGLFYDGDTEPAGCFTLDTYTALRLAGRI